MNWRWFAAWCALVPLMIINGVLRQSVYGPHTHELAAHQLSTATGILIAGLYTWLVHPLLRLRSTRDGIALGSLWVTMTVLFEFGFGHFVAGHSWARLMQDYNLLAGRVWGLFLLILLVLPATVHSTRNRR